MAQDSSVELLEQIPIFKGLSPLQLNAIAAKAKKTFFAAGENIIESGKTGYTAYVILSGSAVSKNASDGSEETLLAGTLVGELAMLVEMTYTATVSAAERIRALAISRSALYEVIERDPALAQHFSDKLMQRLLDLAEELKAVDAQFASIEASLQEAANAA